MTGLWREANLRLLGTSVNDATLASLKDVASLVDLNLATTKITDKGLKSLKGLTNLRRLHLELTAVTDAGLANLKPLAKLTYLNLYGTNVTDAAQSLCLAEQGDRCRRQGPEGGLAPRGSFHRLGHRRTDEEG